MPSSAQAAPILTASVKELDRNANAVERLLLAVPRD